MKLRRLLPRWAPRLVARWEQRDPSLRSVWGGPFNGQLGRRRLARQLLAAISFDEIVETGTYRGTTTAYMAHIARGTAVWSVEIDARFYHYARYRFRAHDGVHVMHGDSRTFLHEHHGNGCLQRTYWPSLPGAQETGNQRGCLVLGTPDLVPVLDTLPALRPCEHYAGAPLVGSA